MRVPRLGLFVVILGILGATVVSGCVGPGIIPPSTDTENMGLVIPIDETKDFIKNTVGK